MSTIEDVRRLKAGDKRAGRALFERFYPMIVRYCRQWTDGDTDAAKDLAQEVLIRAFRDIQNLRNADAFEGWLVSIARNACYSNRSRQTRYHSVLVALQEHGEMISSERNQKAVLGNVVRDFLSSLPEGRMKDIVTMRYRSPGYTTREIAQYLGIPHGTVTVTLMRFKAGLDSNQKAELS